MKMTLRQIIMAPLWSYWTDRFTSNSDKYITPENVMVRDEADMVGTPPSNERMEIVEDVWEHIYSEIRYSLSKEWKEPAETLKEGVGDCEDVDFLLVSMLPNVGVNEGIEIVIGDLIRNTGRTSAHTWVEVDGKIVDPTAHPSVIGSLDYDAKERFPIKFENHE